MTCKHNWQITSADTVTCTHCGEKTGPRSSDQLAKEMMQDVLTIGSAWSNGDLLTNLTPTYAFYEPPKPVGAWVLDPGGAIHTNFQMYSKPTDEQIKNTEAMFGWKWKDLT